MSVTQSDRLPNVTIKMSELIRAVFVAYLAWFSSFNEQNFLGLSSMIFAEGYDVSKQIRHDA